ncbi:hypothetical protein AGMMS49556_09080 [Endomicrobiia bacterium]|nr:hypothetical protein AGMMS49556_09080 [Endomicrobiia bacterium]
MLQYDLIIEDGNEIKKKSYRSKEVMLQSDLIIEDGNEIKQKNHRPWVMEISKFAYYK